MLNEEQIAKLQAFIERYDAGVRSPDKKVSATERGFATTIHRHTGYVFADKRHSAEYKAQHLEFLRRGREVRKAELAEFRAWKAAQAQKQAAE